MILQVIGILQVVRIYNTYYGVKRELRKKALSILSLSLIWDILFQGTIAGKLNHPPSHLPNQNPYISKDSQIFNR